MIAYITKAQMLKRTIGKDYFGLTEYKVEGEHEIYIREDLPQCVKESVLAHEEEHARNGVGSSEWKSWVAGYNANWKGFLLGILLSLKPSRLKLYPELIGIGILIVLMILGILV